MERRKGPVVDGVSRFLGLLAIVAGLGGGFVLYQENQQIKSQLAELQGSTTNYEEAKSFNEKWDKQLTGAMDDFKTRANAALELDAEANLKRQEAFTSEMAELLADRMKLDAMQQRVAQVENIITAPRLLVAENRLRPRTDGSSVQSVVIANEGESDAIIRAARFRTRVGGQFELEKPLTMEPNPEALAIEFLPTDNDAQTLGRHRDYQHTFLAVQPLIQRFQSTPLQVTIRDSRHVGWGWEGQLELEYQDGRILVVPGVRALFVASESDST